MAGGHAHHAGGQRWRPRRAGDDQHVLRPGVTRTGSPASRPSSAPQRAGQAGHRRTCVGRQLQRRRRGAPARRRRRSARRRCAPGRRAGAAGDDGSAAAAVVQPRGQRRRRRPAPRRAPPRRCPARSRAGRAGCPARAAPSRPGACRPAARRRRGSSAARPSALTKLPAVSVNGRDRQQHVGVLDGRVLEGRQRHHQAAALQRGARRRRRRRRRARARRSAAAAPSCGCDSIWPAFSPPAPGSAPTSCAPTLLAASPR